MMGGESLGICFTRLRFDGDPDGVSTQENVSRPSHPALAL
jgi:hypothetical protein